MTSASTIEISDLIDVRWAAPRPIHSHSTIPSICASLAMLMMASTWTV
jgi:hypothetical protein